MSRRGWPLGLLAAALAVLLLRPFEGERPPARRGTPPAAPEPAVGGVVVDGAGVPLPGVRVMTHRTWRGQPPRAEEDAPALATTGPDGRFALPGEPPPTLVLAKRGYRLAEIGVPHRDMRIVLDRGLELSGVVVDTSGAPVPGATVSAYRIAGRSRQDRETGPDGRFAFGCLPRELHALQAAAGGYGLRVLEPADFDGRIVLRRDGVVVEVAGPPPEAVRVLAVRPGGAGAGSPGAPGRWWISPPVAFDLAVLAEGFGPHLARVEPCPGAEPPHLRVTLARGGEPSLAGRVTGAARVRVAVLRGDLLLGAHEGEGAFLFHGLPPGPYRLEASAEGAAPLTRVVAAPAFGLELRLEPEARVRVQATRAGGAPAPGLWVTVHAAEGRLLGEAATGDAGVAEIGALPSGRAVVAAQPAAGAGARDPPSREVVLEAGAAHTVRLVVPSPAPVTVRVRDAAGAPRPGVAVALDPLGRSWARADPRERKRLSGLRVPTDRGGETAWSLYPGAYQAHLVDAARGTTARVDVGEGGGEVDLVMVPFDAAVRGRVLDAVSREPVPGRPVLALDPEQPDFPSWRALAVTDEEGRFLLDRVPAGRVVVAVAARAHANGARDRTSPFAAARTEVDAAAGAVREVDFLLPRLKGDGAAPMLPLAVSLRDARTGEPAGGMEARLEARVDGFWVDAGEVETGADGAASGDVLAAARYRVRVRAAEVGDGRYRDRELEASPQGGALALVLDLEPAR